MELYIGGYAQGKLSHVLEKHKNVRVIDENDIQGLWDSIAAGMYAPKEDQVIIWNHFHRMVKAYAERGWDQEEIWEMASGIISAVPDIVIISDEIGNGIVPMDKEERAYREMNGRLLCRIAGRADTVERIFCGLPQRIKG